MSGTNGAGSALGVLGALTTVPGTIELGALTVAALLPPRAARRDPAACGKLAVVIPAHDEEEGIASCVASLRACEAPPNGVRIVVVADNCADATADRARDAGAEVLVRNDRERRGKGYALELAFAHVIADREVEAVLVVDADTEVRPNFLLAAAGAFGGGADAVQSRYLIGNPDASPRARLMNVAFLAFNVARPRGRERLGLSVGILGNGFGLHRRVIEALPYTARSVVEDLEYHLMLVRRGFAVRFLDETAVIADMPETTEGQRTQRTRWEGGRLRMIREHAPALAREVARGELRLIEPLGELLLLPLATHVGALGVALAVPFPPVQLYAASALALVGAHTLVALNVGGGSRDDLRALAQVPGYVLRKAAMLPSLWKASRKEQAWVRTARDARAND